MAAFGKDVFAFDVDGALGFLAQGFFGLVVHRQQHADIDDLVEMPSNPVEFGRDIRAQRRGDFEMVTVDRQIHGEPPKARVVKADLNWIDRRKLAAALCSLCHVRWQGASVPRMRAPWPLSWLKVQLRRPLGRHTLRA